MKQLQESDEHRALRDAVSAITAKFGPTYYVANAEAGLPSTDLWSALGESGFVGVNLPES